MRRTADVNFNVSHDTLTEILETLDRDQLVAWARRAHQQRDEAREQLCTVRYGNLAVVLAQAVNDGLTGKAKRIAKQIIDHEETTK